MSRSTGIVNALRRLIRATTARTGAARSRTSVSTNDTSVTPGQHGATATVEIDVRAQRSLRITYAPSQDGDPDAGEIVWTWVPYVERDGRGKDRPVLVIGRQSADRVFAVKLTSRPHEGEHDYLPIGSGPWDSKGRDSWVDIDQVYSVHNSGMRREAAALDLDRFVQVAHALSKRYGWSVGE
ncbi:type II toxin-antitoxin system PemK/MazF family toxin [Microbacterium sp. NPDC076911]|uniref:type II toxin-antitoxin system PemK/MazF family toxin n=1 Tax=Microbacterium sp. NPDC076911 TaxID=3154958 RepID=UPI0034477E6D